MTKTTEEKVETRLRRDLMKKRIIRRLEEMDLHHACRENREYAVIADGRPIGMTVSGRLDFGRWWPWLQVSIADAIVEMLEEERKANGK